MKKNLKLIITIIAVIFLVGIGITVAYYSVNITGNPSATNITIGAGTVSLQFSDGSSTINVQNLLPGWEGTKTFTVTNTSTATDAELSYQIKLIITENGFPNGSFKYSLTGTGTGSINKGNTDITSNNIVIGTANITGAGTIHNYTFTLTYKNLSTDQSADMGKILKGYITIEGTSGSAMSPIYGVKRSISASSTAWERTDASIGLVANATKDGSAVANDFDNIYPWSEIKTCNMALDGTINAWYGDANFKFDGTNGEVMTYIPAFYYKRVQEGGYEYQYISATPKEGYTKSEAFYIGRYDIYESGSKAHSQSGVMPTVSKTITEFRTLAKSNGTGWGQLDWRYFLIQMLYLVEYADYNSQSKLGSGITSLATEAGRQTQGGCDTLGMKSGSLVNDGGHCVIYRGIEDVFGNVWQFVDGINIKDNRAYINYNPATYQVDKFNGDYQMMGYVNAASNGYPKTLGYDANQPLISFPTSVGGSNTTYMSDYYYQNPGNRIALVGGLWASGTNAGIWSWYLNDPSSDGSGSVGVRLIKYTV